MKKLLNKAEIFYQNSLSYFYKSSSLRRDMLRRIMHSILPSITDKQVNSPYETVDYRSLVLAADGRKDIIFYGTKACVDEARHYYEKLDPKPLIATQLQTNASLAFNSGKFEDAIQLCRKAFSDQNKGAWRRNYGGGAWYKIADTIFELIKLDNELTRLVKERAADTEKILILNEIITYLNVFDGLAHNTSSIYTKLVEIENKYAPKAKSKEKGWDEDIVHYMNSKELKDPVETFRVIAPEIVDDEKSGIYSEYFKKLQNHPSYNVDLNNLKYNLMVVSYRKNTKPFIDYINGIFNNINSYNVDFNYNELSNYLYTILSHFNGEHRFDVGNCNFLSACKGMQNSDELLNKKNKFFDLQSLIKIKHAEILKQMIDLGEKIDIQKYEYNSVLPNEKEMKSKIIENFITFCNWLLSSFEDFLNNL